MSPELPQRPGSSLARPPALWRSTDGKAYRSETRPGGNLALARRGLAELARTHQRRPDPLHPIDQEQGLDRGSGRGPGGVSGSHRLPLGELGPAGRRCVRGQRQVRRAPGSPRPGQAGPGYRSAQRRADRARRETLRAGIRQRPVSRAPVRLRQLPSQHPAAPAGACREDLGKLPQRRAAHRIAQGRTCPRSAHRSARRISKTGTGR